MSTCHCVGAIASSDSRGYRVQAASRLLQNVHELERAQRSLRLMMASPAADRVEDIRNARIEYRLIEASRMVSAILSDAKVVGTNLREWRVETDDGVVTLVDLAKSLRGNVRIMSAEGGAGGGGGGGEPPKGPSDGPAPTGNKDKTFWERLYDMSIGALVALVVSIGTAVGKLVADLFNATDDDDARKWVNAVGAEVIKETSETDLVNKISAMLDGPTGADDENAILSILRSLDCAARSSLVHRIGMGELLFNLDGDQWDELVILLQECGLIAFDKMDDNASRLFVDRHNCVQLGQLPMGDLRQLVLNMFSGDCGDDDEDSILKLLRCQSGDRMRGLVQMKRTGTDEFDYNFDGDQWDDLEVLFATHGITLD